MPVVRPYDSWKSPITSDLIAAATIRLGEVTLHGDDVYWLESRPSEGGRNVLMRARAGGVEELTPAPFNVRTRVHEYGGGAYVVAGDAVYFSNFADQRLYRLGIDVGSGDPGTPTTSTSRVNAVSPEGPLRFADAVVDPLRRRLILVVEDHAAPGREPVNYLGALDPGSGSIATLVGGADFYSSPRLSPDGTRLAWLSWSHPNMPWDGNELWLADVARDGSLSQMRLLAGGPTESLFQPQWSPDGRLYVVSDRSGWWNIYDAGGAREAREAGGASPAAVVEPVVAMDAEFGRPQWEFRNPTYGFVSSKEIVCTFVQDGRWRLGRVNLETRQLTTIELGFTQFDHLQVSGRWAAFIAGAPDTARSIVRLDLETDAIVVLRRSSDVPVDLDFVSMPEAIEFGTSGDRRAHGFFYPPRNADFAAPGRERPPLLVISHGGPTAAAASVLDLRIQFWTSRGFAVLDVNYGGSTGYGRHYREVLDGRWGVVDVEDCVNGAREVARLGWADANRMTISGGSAGGYTTLLAVTFSDVFRAGASYYGVSDLAALVRDTHKFESRYLDRLVGPYPERVDLYEARSPLHHVDRLVTPMIFFQGLDDHVVPPSQTESMVQALRAKGVAVEYLSFEDEQHGFRRADTIKRALDAELAFYARVLGLEPADPREPEPVDPRKPDDVD